MSGFAIGKQAEQTAADLIQARGFTIVARNWKIRSCEIDIVAKKHECIYFIEVKYRSSSGWGYAIEYITTQKLRQMSYAAGIWVHFNQWPYDYRLAVISIDRDRSDLLLLS